MVFKQKMKIYNLSMVLKLELCIIVQLLHISTTGFWFDIKEKERQKKNKQKYVTTAAATTTTLITTKKRFRMVLILISYYDRRPSKARYTIGINAKIKQYILSMVITLQVYEINIVLQKHKKQLNLLTFTAIMNYDLKVLKENSFVQSMHVVTTKFDWVFFDIKTKGKKKRKNMQHHKKNIKLVHCLFE